MDLANVHVCTIAVVHAWTLYKAPSVDPQKNHNKKSLALEGIQPQSVAWKSSA